MKTLLIDVVVPVSNFLIQSVDHKCWTARTEIMKYKLYYIIEYKLVLHQ